MTVDSVEEYKKLLSKELKVGDKYVIIDVKWFQNWKRFVKIDSSDEEPQPPGEIDFTQLVDSETIGHADGVQLKSTAVEGNDYVFIPIELYTEFEKKFGKIGNEIIREVIPTKTNGDNYVIETVLVPLRMCSSKYSTINIKQIYRSRRTKLETLKRDICKIFSFSESGKSLYFATDIYGHYWDEVEARADAVLDDIQILKNAYVTCDSTKQGSSTTEYDTKPSNSGRYTPGLCGLSNLGNTCFMNSALQCLSNVPELTEYFAKESHLEEINYDNPLGMKGDVAKAYGDLIKNMWSGDTDYVAPKKLKLSVSRYAPQFSGFNQQDSQEFMSFLLDGLHEDLNRVKKKPYAEKKDDDGKISNELLAQEHWSYYAARNQSKIQEIFHGQIRSEVHCLTCNKTARTFDPFCFLSLPLPEKKKNRRYKIEYFTLEGEIFKYSVKSNENGRMKDLVADFCRLFQKKEADKQDPTAMDVDPTDPFLIEDDEDDDQEIKNQNDSHLYEKPPDPQYIAPAEVYSNRIHTLFRDDSFLSNILERDRIVFYQTKHSLKTEGDRNILMPCTFRSTSYYKSTFGLPFYIGLPRKDCKGKHVQEALEEVIGKILPLPEPEKSSTSPYSASLIYSDYGYSQPRALSNVLNDSIDFVKKNVSLQIEVDEQIANKYEEREKALISPPKKNYFYDEKKPKRPVTLDDCLKYFVSRETLSDDDLWFCPSCKELRKAAKKMDLWRLPPILIIQLKRFNYTRYWRDKIDVTVDFPITNLNLSPYIINDNEKENAVYDLISISNHMGGLGGGHYTAYGKNKIDQQWHSFDDGFVSSVQDTDRMISKSAYVLIYERRKPTNNNRPASSKKPTASTE